MTPAPRSASASAKTQLTVQHDRLSLEVTEQICIDKEFGAVRAG